MSIDSLMDFLIYFKILKRVTIIDDVSWKHNKNKNMKTQQRQNTLQTKMVAEKEEFHIWHMHVKIW